MTAGDLDGGRKWPLLPGVPAGLQDGQQGFEDLLEKFDGKDQEALAQGLLAHLDRARHQNNSSQASTRVDSRTEGA